MAKGKSAPKRQSRPIGLPRVGGKRMLAAQQRVASGLDVAGRRYLSLLSDPCASDLCPPTYGGTGSGYLMRTKQFVSPSVTTQDALFEYCPGSSFPSRLSVASTTGGTLNAAVVTGVPGPLSSIAESYRPIAACVKVYYTGSELNRAGMVFGNLMDAATLAGSEVPGGITAATYATSAARFVRLGSEMHEFRWCPNEADQTFTTVTGTVPAAIANGSTLQIGYFGCPPGTVSFEITTVWEWQPITGSSSSGNIVSTPRAPVSPQPLNAVLHSIGNLASWATKPGNMGGLLKAGQGLYNSTKYIRPAMLALAM